MNINSLNDLIRALRVLLGKNGNIRIATCLAFRIVNDNPPSYGDHAAWSTYLCAYDPWSEIESDAKLTSYLIESWSN